MFDVGVGLECMLRTANMTVRYCFFLYDRDACLLFDVKGIGPIDRRKDEKGTFVVETHNLYERELLVGERVRIATQILGADDKRLHVGHEMFRVRDSERSATQELMFLHIDLKARRMAAVSSAWRVRGLAWTAPPS